MSELRQEYWAPTQVKLFAHTEDGAVWLDDAIGLDIQIEDQRVPHYGFRDRFYRDVSYGRTIVSGNLYVAFRHPNYLSTVVRNAGLTGVTEPPASRGVAFSVPKTIDQSPLDESVELLAETLRTSVDNYIAFAREFRNLYYSSTPGVSTTTGSGGHTFRVPLMDKQGNLLPVLPVRVSAKRAATVQAETRKKLFVQVQYGDHTLTGGQFTQYIDGVVFTSERRTVSMLDGMGDQSILEVYGFLARNVRAVPPVA